MSIVLHGQPITKLGDRVIKTQDGWQTIETYQGLEGPLKELQFQFDDEGYDTELSPIGARRELRVSKPFALGGNAVTRNMTNDQEDQWTVAVQEYRRDIASHPFLIDAIPDSFERAAKIAEADAEIQEGTASFFLDNSSVHEAIKKYVRYRLVGTNYYITYAPVVTRTIMAARTSTLRADLPSDGVPKVVPSTAIPAPASIMFRIPAGWQWMQVPPDVASTPDRSRVRITFQWVGANSWADLYEGGSFAP